MLGFQLQTNSQKIAKVVNVELKNCETPDKYSWFGEK